MKENYSTLFCKNLMLFKTSKQQESFLNESTYSLLTPCGRNFERTFEMLARNTRSGKILVKEKVVYGSEKYEKIFVLSKDGKSEKFKGDHSF